LTLKSNAGINAQMKTTHTAAVTLALLVSAE